MPHFVLFSRRFHLSFSVLAVILACASAARAQGIGFQGGATIDPNQAFIGTHFETGELMPNFRFRPADSAATIRSRASISNFSTPFR